jgi:hypothetical protein
MTDPVLSVLDRAAARPRSAESGTNVRLYAKNALYRSERSSICMERAAVTVRAGIRLMAASSGRSPAEVSQGADSARFFG